MLLAISRLESFKIDKVPIFDNVLKKFKIFAMHFESVNGGGISSIDY